MTKMRIRRPDDMHVHLRDGSMLLGVAKHTAAQFARALVMPNTDSPILTGEDAVRYRARIHESAPGLSPLMTVKLTRGTTPDMIPRAKGAGVVAAKFYPEGMTTNSDDGARSPLELDGVLAAMEKCGMVLCLHGETPGAFCMDRESAFLGTLTDVARSFPKLRIVLEHVTTKTAVTFVQGLPDNVAATITVHHLRLTLDDVVGGKISPHNFCKPIAKTPSDREALRRAAVSGNPKFFLGTDSAPHAVAAKECSSGCAGVFSAPVAMQALACEFEELGALDRLETFCSEFGARFYGLPMTDAELELERSEWTVPATFDGVVPYRAGERLAWSLAR